MKFLRIVVGLTLILQATVGFRSSAITELPSSALVISHVQTAGASTGTSNQELVVVYNNAKEQVEVTNWCLEYSPAKTTLQMEDFTIVGCLEVSDNKTQLWVEPGGNISFARAEYLTQNPLFLADVSLSGRSFAASAGLIRLVDQNKVEIDRVGWGTTAYAETEPASAHSAGSLLARNLLDEVYTDTNNNKLDFSETNEALTIISGLFEVEVVVDQCENIDGLQEIIPEGYLLDGSDCYYDVCLEIDGLQLVLPDGYMFNSQDECIEIPKESRAIVITELYPNAPSYDTGNEFIELHNPHGEAITLKGYSLQVGPSYTKQFTFGEILLKPKSYKVFSDTETGIILPNTEGVTLRLLSPAGTVVSETATYADAQETDSWSLIDGQWLYTNQITPGAENLPYLESIEDDEVLGSTSVLGPCPIGKYRNPETNRCRNIETAVSQLVPCDEDEYRNPETNRCRKKSSSTSSLKPCPAGQERNPTTNRCRKIVAAATLSSNTDAQVTDVPPDAQTNRFNWTIVGPVVLGTSSYMIYEWRTELRRLFEQFKKR